MPTEKKGKLFVKDSGGNLVQIIPEAVPLIPDYQGATSSAAGSSGLVPAALSTQREKYLRGDGTWQDACVPTGVCNCTYTHVRGTFHAGVNICDGDGSWLSTAITLDASIYPDEVRLYHVNFRFGADGPGGCAYWLPYNTTAPQTMEERTYEFYRDSTVFQRNNSNHFIQTFSNGFSMDSWIEVDTEQSGYHYLYIRVYGPTAPDIPRAVPLNVDGTDVFLTQNLTAGQSADIPVSGTTIKLYPRPTYRTALYRNEFYEYSGTAGFEPVEITSTEYAPPYLSYTAVRTSTGIRITANSVNINGWPQELSSVSLSLTSGTTTNVIDMNCLPGWVSTQLTKIDEKIAAVNTRINNISVYQGATANESGVIGLVPAAMSSEKDKFLRGDGTWAEATEISNADMDSIWESVFDPIPTVNGASLICRFYPTPPSNGECYIMNETFDVTLKFINNGNVDVALTEFGFFLVITDSNPWNEHGDPRVAIIEPGEHYSITISDLSVSARYVNSSNQMPLEVAFSYSTDTTLQSYSSSDVTSEHAYYNLQPIEEES